MTDTQQEAERVDRPLEQINDELRTQIEERHGLAGMEAHGVLLSQGGSLVPVSAADADEVRSFCQACRGHAIRSVERKDAPLQAILDGMCEYTLAAGVKLGRLRERDLLLQVLRDQENGVTSKFPDDEHYVEALLAENDEIAAARAGDAEPENTSKQEPKGRRVDGDDGIRLLRELQRGEGGGQWQAHRHGTEGETEKLPLFIVLVDTTPYDGGGYQWVPVDHLSPGTASRYPIKGRTPDGGMGQWGFEEPTAIVITEVGEEWLRSRDLASGASA